MTFAQRAKQIFNTEIVELQRLADGIDQSFDLVVEAILECKGKLVLMGIGKTGHIANKIASSLASTGTPSIFVNAAEAVHGDLGMVTKDDVVMLVSNSGSTNEILSVIKPLRQIGCRLIAMTGNPNSPLAHDCDLVLSIHVDHEVCPLGLAPTTSTTATLLMGDALIVCLMEHKHFKAENFAIYHPGGALGRQLLHSVRNCMTQSVPKVPATANFKQITKQMSDSHLGMTLVYDNSLPIGIITDGDVRRTIQNFDDLSAITARQIMTPQFKYISANCLLTEALELMDKYNITTLAVVEDMQPQHVVGILSIHHIIDFN